MKKISKLFNKFYMTHEIGRSFGVDCAFDSQAPYFVLSFTHLSIAIAINVNTEAHILKIAEKGARSFKN